MTVYRCFVEKKSPFAVEAEGVKNDLRIALRSDAVEDVRVLNRYDLENIDEQDYLNARYTILSEPQVDDLYEEEAPAPATDEWVLAVEYLPGQFDQRADSCAQCIQLATMRQRPDVRTARIYYISGNLSKSDKARIRETLINPVEAREAALEKPETIRQNYPKPDLPEVLDGFRKMDEEGRRAFCQEMGLAMDMADLEFLQEYYKKEEKRDPTVTEVRVIDTYWSDHCRHTTFNTILEDIEIEPDYIREAFSDYLDLREEVYAGREAKPVSLWDLATIGAKALKAEGKLKDLDASEEINACSVRIKVDVDGNDEDWLLMFKNETHNHPTEIEPFGGAATCLGGAIRDPLSGRSYVYQAMRITGAADPLTPVEETMHGKLPQRKIVTTAAAGYSSYGNQIGLATGLVHELYHPGYVAKRMEVGAVIGAAPAENVVRERPQPGDVVILLGGRTGRDGCGGATGSSKSHTVESLESCGAEVQKGNAPEERKLQRLFRNPEATRLIKRCNDFGAGGVSVAIGELADGLHIDLSKVPKKYEGLDGTELAISESQERMAVVTSAADAKRFRELADEENLESTIVAEVTEERRLVMELDGHTIVDISRDFLDTNGAKRYADARITVNEPEQEEDTRHFKQRFADMITDLNCCSQKGLAERFDSTIGSGTVLMPFGGKYQLTEAQAMACKLPVLNGETKTVSLMGWGFDPYQSSANPYLAAQSSVITSVAKVIAAGGSLARCWMSFQEFFGKTSSPEKWGAPMAALLGGLKAQMNLGVAAIGGKDSMSGTFEDIDVPPTLISFAVSTTDTGNVVSAEFKEPGHYVYLLKPAYDSNGEPNYDSVLHNFRTMENLIKDGIVLSAWTLERGGAAEGLFKMMTGSHIGFETAGTVNEMTLFDKCAGAFLIETDSQLSGFQLIGKTVEDYVFRTAEVSLNMDHLQEKWEGTLQSVFPYLTPTNNTPIPEVSYDQRGVLHASYTVKKPKVLIPVFPGTNCEWDTARAFEKAGAEARIYVIRNRSSEEIEKAADEFAALIKESQIIALPGGFSGGDEPDGSGKFITAFFRNPKVRSAVSDLLDNREGLMCGICNGFQALIKLGLVPYGKIMDTDAHCPTLTFNSIGRHQSMLVRTRIASVKSPWLQFAEVGDVHHVAISHGEGRFVAEDEVISELLENGQIATQYVDLENHPTGNVRFNPNNSYYAIEGITSKDGRIFGKMGHSERSGDGMYQNIPVLNLQETIFKGAVAYFK
ncbi:MAG: phosphoribosylformylglycinamidine synthase [Erysipelotrichaceae bacterium]|nr:phosphoribosylformylglycinamidine synthase [Erysipelotrichaceae bacterium]